MMQLAITYNDRTLFHMLRHFETINDGAKNCLIKRGYSLQAMEEAMRLLGSKFYAEFAQDLKKLEEQLALGQLLSQETIGKYLYVQLRFEPSVFPNGIGTIGVVPLSDLAKLGARSLGKKENRGVCLQHAIVDHLSPTWEMSLILKPQKNYHLLITAFPGTKAFPVPQSNMSDLVFQACTQFWENHVFLELA
jgi:hypothetical protein